MARLPEIRREDLSAGDQQHFDSIAGSRGAVRGPFAMLLHSPDMAARIAHAGAYIRFETSLAAPLRELAILTVARSWDCQYEWSAHQPIAGEAGVRPEAIAAIRDRTAPAGLTGEEATIFNYVHELLTNKRISEATYQKALDALGAQTLVDLTATAGYYSLIATTLNAHDVQPEEGKPRLLPE
jgi:4-carboxymuconolactone decarboxylase